MVQLEPFLRAIAVDFDWRRIQSTRSLVLFLIFMGIFVGWIEAWHLLAGGGHSPFDGTEDSCDVVELFSLMGFAIGLSLAISIPLSRHLLIRVPLAAFVGAGLVTLTVQLGTVDRFCPAFWTAREDCILDDPMAWGLLLGAPLCGGLAFSMHLLRRTSGKLRLTLLSIIISLILGFRSQQFFWLIWDDRSLPDFHCGLVAEAYTTPGRSLGFVAGLYFCLGTLLLDFGSRLSVPGSFRALSAGLIRRVRIPEHGSRSTS